MSTATATSRVNKAALDGYTNAIEELPEGCFLGSLLFFSISQADVNLEKAHRDLKDLGLSTDRMRKQLRPYDAFRKAAKRFEHKFRPENGLRSELSVRPVGDDQGNEMFRFLILERSTVEAGVRKRVSYDKVGELRFDKGQRTQGKYVGHSVECLRTTTVEENGKMVSTLEIPLTEAEDQWLTEQLTTFADNYDHLLNYMDSHAVRTFVREYIYSLSGVCVKESGGLYFAKQEHANEIDRLGSWVRTVGSEFHTIPLLNVIEQRDMIREAFEDETIREVDSLMAEIAKILNDEGRKIEERTFDAFSTRALELTAKMKEYNDMLGSKTEHAETQIGIYRQQMMALASRIKPA